MTSQTNEIVFYLEKEYSMDSETVILSNMDSETISILLDDRFATGG
jgi:hypothetical protein